MVQWHLAYVASLQCRITSVFPPATSICVCVYLSGPVDVLNTQMTRGVKSDSCYCGRGMCLLTKQFNQRMMRFHSEISGVSDIITKVASYSWVGSWKHFRLNFVESSEVSYLPCPGYLWLDLHSAESKWFCEKIQNLAHKYLVTFEGKMYECYI